MYVCLTCVTVSCLLAIQQSTTITFNNINKEVTRVTDALRTYIVFVFIILNICKKYRRLRLYVVVSCLVVVS